MGKNQNPLDLNNVTVVSKSQENALKVEKIIYDDESFSNKYPVLPLKDISPFPGIIVPIYVGREFSVKAVNYANNNNSLIFLVAQKDPAKEEVTKEDLYEYGVLSEIKQIILLPDKTLKILIECKITASILELNTSEECGLEAKLNIFNDPIFIKSPEERAVLQDTLRADFDKLSKSSKAIDVKIISVLENLKNSFELVYYLIERLQVSPAEKQEFLIINDEQELLEKAIVKVRSLIEIVEIERKIKNRLKNKIEKNQKDYYLNEQIKAIQKELGDYDDKEEISKLEKKIKTIKLSEHAKETATVELKKLKHMNQFSSEYSIVKNYLDFLTALPWGVHTEPNSNLENIKNVLNESHFGIQEVKDRVYEMILQKNRVKKFNKAPVLCFYGPPGIGKTSFAYSIGKAIGYKTISIPLGGMKDESSLRGHRRTYIGAMPGKIMQAIKDAGSSNLVIVLDEVGSMGADWRGNPEDVLLEILDPMQNHSFQDNYLGTGYDLSGVIFIATTNYVDRIKPALLDRLEIISLSGYTQEEKAAISRNYLIPKLLKEHALNQDQFIINDDILNQVISNYTYESGVRGLEKQLAKLVRKSMKIIEETSPLKAVAVTIDEGLSDDEDSSQNNENSQINNALSVNITSEKLFEFLKKPIYLADEKKPSRVGVVNGLAYIGKREGQEGEVLSIEAVLVPGEGKVEFTGNLGDMMKESVQIAFKKILSMSSVLSIDVEELKKKNVYINFPSGGTPKDGPSAGVAIFCAMFSAIKGFEFPNNVAMTGEIGLFDAMKVGGIKEKLLAAYRYGIKKVFIPYENKMDLDDLTNEVLSQMQVIPIKEPEEVLRNLGLIKNV